MLDQYLQRTQLLLGDTSFEFFNEPDLTTYVNIARGQLAGESECIRLYRTLDVSDASQEYAFASIDLTGITTSVLGVLNVRQASFTVATGAKPLHSRPWPWFQQYVLSQPVPTAGPPSTWSQLGQGASGTLYVNILDGAYTLNLDVVGYPVNLTDDSTPEAIPYTWTDAVPYYAAYLALFAVNPEKADRMFKEYERFVARARSNATPSVLPGNYPQSPDMMMANRLGMQQKAGA